MQSHYVVCYCGCGHPSGILEQNKEKKTVKNTFSMGEYRISSLNSVGLGRSVNR